MRALIVIGAGAVLAAGVLTGPGLRSGAASNHIDAPSQVADNQLDTTDTYLFTSPDRRDTITAMSNWGAFEVPGQLLPWYRFVTEGHYDLNFDTTGDGEPEYIYRFTFTNDDGARDHPPTRGASRPPIPMPWTAGVLRKSGEHRQSSTRPPAGDERRAARQSYTVTLHQPGRASRKLAENVPVATGGSRARNVVDLPGGGKAYAGPNKDPFFYWFPTNVHAIAVQLPKRQIALNGDPRRNPVVGFWSTAYRHRFDTKTGKTTPVQVSRHGLSGFSSAVLPAQLRDAYHQRSSPATDHKWTAMLNWVRSGSLGGLFGVAAAPNPVSPAKQLEQLYLYGIAKTTGPVKKDLNAHVLNADADRGRIRPAEMARLNMLTPVTRSPRKHGLLDGDVQGWPHGRRLSDDTFSGFGRLAAGEPATKSPLSLVGLVPLAVSGQPPARYGFPYVHPPL